MSRWNPPLTILLSLALLMSSAAVAEKAREARASEVENDVVYLPSPEALSVLSAGYDQLLADYYWLRTITYYGEWRQGDHGIAFFRELARTVVTLDPKFTEAYRFASIVLADDMQSMDDAVEFLRLGMRNNPTDWYLPFEAGFLEYTVRKDDEAAYRWFLRASRKPEAPEIPARFAAFVASRAGELAISYELWRFVAETTENPTMRDKALEYMGELEAAIRGTGPVPEWAKRRTVVPMAPPPEDDDEI